MSQSFNLVNNGFERLARTHTRQSESSGDPTQDSDQRTLQSKTLAVLGIVMLILYMRWEKKKWIENTLNTVKSRPVKL